jgi:hypothetical protein
LISTRAKTISAGSVQIKLGFTPAPNSNNLMDFDEIYAELLKRSRPSLVSAPPVRVPPILPFISASVYFGVKHIFCRLRVLARFDPISLQRTMVDSLPSPKIQMMKKSI